MFVEDADTNADTQSRGYRAGSSMVEEPSTGPFCDLRLGNYTLFPLRG
jgi:hypothetical protein